MAVDLLTFNGRVCLCNSMAFAAIEMTVLSDSLVELLLSFEVSACLCTQLQERMVDPLRGDKASHLTHQK